MYGNAAHAIYAQNNIGIESPAKLVEMMYEGVLRFNAQMKKNIIEENIEKKTYWVNRSIAVIVELMATLDLSQGEIAAYLNGLYSHQVKLLIEANLEDDLEKLHEVNSVFKTLLESWKEAN